MLQVLFSPRQIALPRTSGSGAVIYPATQVEGFAFRAIMESARSEPFKPRASNEPCRISAWHCAGLTSFPMNTINLQAPPEVGSDIQTASGAGGRNSKSRCRYQLAQTMRASLLATATAALLWPPRARTRIALLAERPADAPPVERSQPNREPRGLRGQAASVDTRRHAY